MFGLYFDDYDTPVFRPPSEANSFILRVTRGCAHNTCTFCAMYKDVQFALCPNEEISRQIALAARYAQDQVKRIFLADGDALVLPTEKLLKILAVLYQTFPHLQRVTSYAGPRDILRKSDEEMRRLREAGLKMLYFGLETGDDALLARIKKGVTAEEAIAAGQKVVRSGMKLSMMVIAGLGGKADSERHAVETGKAVTAIQPNIEPYTEKFTLPQQEQDSIILALAASSPVDADFIIAPETAVDDNIWENRIGSSAAVARYLAFIRNERPEAQFITGATTLKLYRSEREKTFSARPLGDGRWYDVYNSALAIDSAGGIAVHHKAKLVIGVEMMPFMELLAPFTDFIVDLGGTTGRLGTDNYYRIFRLQRDGREIRTAAPICYESVYGEHFATFARHGAELLFVITNDGWWRDTAIHRQHFSFSRLRAIEHRRAVARSANTGISGFINARGDVVGPTLGWARRGVLTAPVALSDELTVYTRYGDYLGRIAQYVMLLCLLYYVAYRVKRRNYLVD